MSFSDEQDRDRIVALDLVDACSRLTAVDAGGRLGLDAALESVPDATRFFVDDEGRPWAGAAARRRSLSEPAHACWRPVAAFFGVVPGQGEADLDPFAPVQADGEGAVVSLRGRQRRLAAVLTLILDAWRERVGDALGSSSPEIVLSHPGWLGARRREGLARVARAAGFEGVTTIARAVAAAIALEREGERGRLGVLRLERCGIDAVVADLDDGSVEVLRSVALPVPTSADPVFGLVGHLVDGFIGRNEGSVVLHDSALARIHDAAECGLDLLASGQRLVSISMPYVDEGASRSPHLMDRLDATVLARSCEAYGELLGSVLAEALDGQVGVDRWIVCGQLAGLEALAQAVRAATSAEVVLRPVGDALTLDGLALEAERRVGAATDPLFLLSSAPHAISLGLGGEAADAPAVERFATLPVRVRRQVAPPAGTRRLQVDLLEGESARPVEAYRPVSFELSFGSDADEVELELEVGEDGATRLGAIDATSGHVRFLDRAEDDEDRESAGASESLSDEALALARPVERLGRLNEARQSLSGAIEALARDESQALRGSDRSRTDLAAAEAVHARTVLAEGDPEAMRQVERRLERFATPSSR